MKATKQDIKAVTEAFNHRLDEFLLDQKDYQKRLLITIVNHDFKTKRDLDFFKGTALMGFNKNMRNFLEANEAMDKLSEEANDLIKGGDDE